MVLADSASAEIGMAHDVVSCCSAIWGNIVLSLRGIWEMSVETIHYPKGT